MTIEEAFAEMKRRGWGFARNDATGMIVIGPIINPEYEERGEVPLIKAWAFGTDPVETLQTAIEREGHKQ